MNSRVTKTRDTLSADLQRKVRTMKNPANALRAMGTVLVSLAQRAFNEPGVRLLPWDPLKPATIKAKKRKGYSEGILKASGTLMRSPRLGEVTANTVTITSDRPYARYHQLGTKHIPPRPFFPVRPGGQLAEKAAQLVRAAAVRAINKDLKG